METFTARSQPGSKLAFGTRGWALMLALALIAGAFAIPAFAQGPDHKRFTADFDLAVDDPGTIVLTIKNTTTRPQNIGSVDVTAPAGVTLVPNTAEILGDQQGSATVVGNTVQLRDVAILRDHQSSGTRSSLTVTFGVDGCSTEPWGILAKQSNNFQGTGNDFVLDVGNSDLVTGCVIEVDCEPRETCELPVSGANMTITFKGTAKDSDDARMSVELLAADVDVECGVGTTLDLTVEAFHFDLDNMESPIEMTMVVDAADDEDSDGFRPRSASDYQLCWLGIAPFRDQDGGEVDSPEDGFPMEGFPDLKYGPSFVQGCPAKPDGGYGELDEDQFPCGVSWVNVMEDVDEADGGYEAGQRVIKYLLPAKDPIGAWK